MPVFAVWLLLFLVYVLMPNTTVSKRSAAIGSLVAAILWTISKDVFRLYVSHGVIGSLYGALALLPLFLLWLWVTWLIILFGLELTYALQAMQGKNRQFKHLAFQKQTEDTLVDPAWMLPLSVRIAAAFEQGQSPSLAQLSEAVNLPQRVVRKMLNVLEEAKIIHRVGNGPTELRYTLARPADHITVREVLDASDKLLPSTQTVRDESTSAWRFIDEMHDAAHRMAEHRTLGELARSKNDLEPPMNTDEHGSK